MLHRHFQAEEYPGGLYDRLGATSPRFRDDVRELVDDHFRILGTLRGLSSRLRAGDGDLETILRQRGRIATRLAEHEKREHDMALAARQQAGD